MNIVIVGAGEVGFHLARRLIENNHNITILEADAEKARRAEEQLDAMVVVGSGSSWADLQRANITQADILAALSNVDEVNLLACMYARKVNVPHKIARVRNPEFTAPDFILSHQEMGVDLLIHPEKETADAIVRLIRQSSATDVIEFAGGQIQLLGIRLEQNSPILRRPLKEIWQEYNDIPARFVAIKRKEHTIIPSGEDVLAPGDQTFVICDRNAIPTVLKITGKENVRIQNIMILGGGLIGQFVASALEDEINIKIIESRAERSEHIATLLKRSLIIHGDGTDMDLLALEGIIDMDAFIAVTGDDETNIISSLMARHLQVPRTIALVNKTEYLPITPTIGMDAVVSKKLITVDAILRFIQRTTFESVATIPGMDAEIIEIIPHSGSRIVKKPLKKVHFPRSAIVGAVYRKDAVIVPRGDTQIQPGDRVVIFALPSAISAVEHLFE